MMTQPRGWPGRQAPDFADVNFVWPAPGDGQQGNNRLTGVGRGNAELIPMSVAGTLTEFQSLIGGPVTTGGDITGSLEVINASTGLVDGTLVAAGASATITVTTGAATQYYSFVLSTPVQVTAGQLIAFVVRLEATTDCRLYYYGANSRPPNVHPSRLDNTGGTWVKRGGTAGSMRYKVDNVWVNAPQAWPYDAALVGASIGTASTPDEVGDLFTMPATMRCNGACAQLQAVSLTEDWTLSLLNLNNDVIRSFTMDMTITATDNYGLYWVYWDPVTLYAGEQYRLILTPLTSGNFSRFSLSVEDEKYVNLLPANGSWIKTERTNGGPWTDTKTAYIHMGLSINGVSM